MANHKSLAISSLILIVVYRHDDNNSSNKNLFHRNCAYKCMRSDHSISEQSFIRAILALGQYAVQIYPQVIVGFRSDISFICDSERPNQPKGDEIIYKVYRETKYYYSKY